MPTLALPNGVSIYYEDSGAVPGVAYTTLIFVHGMGFNSGVFKKLHGPAAAHKYRIVAFNRRGYSHTDPFTDADRKLLVEDPRKFIHNMGIELAHFIDKFIAENDIPLPTESGEGGVVPIGWSLGALNIQAFLSALDELDAPTLDRLNKYVHTLVIHDISPVIIGVDNPTEMDIGFWLNPDPKVRFSNFKDWAVSYFKHRDIHSKISGDLTYNCPWEFTPEKAAELNLLVHERKPTFSDISAEELNELTDYEAFSGADAQDFIIFSAKEFCRDVVRQALFDKGLAAKLPAKVRYLGSGETPGNLVFANWELQKALDDPASSIFGGEKARDVKVLYTPKGNHFIFWDDPEDALVQFRRAIVE